MLPSFATCNKAYIYIYMRFKRETEGDIYYNFATTARCSSWRLLLLLLCLDLVGFTMYF